MVCVLLGGTRSALSGPGLTTSLVCSAIIARHGLEGLGMVLYLAGLLQVATGALGLGRFVRLVPLSVLRACVFGMGLVILLRQLPHMLGAANDPAGNVLVHVDRLAAHLSHLNPAVLAVSIGSGLLGALGLLRARIPGALLALVVSALAVQAFGLELPSVFESDLFPLPRRPLPPSSGFAHLVGSVFELWGAMTFGTAINTLALEKHRAGAGASERCDPDQELIGNGLATVALAFLHGLPATQLFARSAIALRLGVSSPRPALVQAFALLAAGIATWPLLRQPHTLFITCADSRVDPALLMGSHPGDRFVVRAIGALVAPCGSDLMPQEGAAVEYGVGVLGVRTIVVCGHSKCGAISALKKGKVPEELTTLHTWSQQAAGVAGEVESFADTDEATRAVTVRQIENLMSYPLVKAKHSKGELQIHAWFYDLGDVELFEWDPARKAYAVLSAEPRPLSLPPAAGGAKAE